MATIDPTARVEDGATLHPSVSIGPFCLIGRDVTIDAGTRLIGHCYVSGKTTIGENCTIHPFASLGGPPQSLAHRGEVTRLEIGPDCTIRESAVINAGTVGGGGITRIGARCFVMSATHVAHDCLVGNDVIIASGAAMGGHCEIGDFAFLGGLCTIHQFTRVGAQTMIGASAAVRGDIIPFGMVTGQPGTLQGLNVVGMKRRKFTRARLAQVHRFYRALFHGAGHFADRLQQARSAPSSDEAIADILAFITRDARRALCMPARQ